MHNNSRRRKARVVDITNYKNSVNFECDRSGYVCHGVRGARLHLKYSHGVVGNKSVIKIEQFCLYCNRVFYEPISEHMIQHREEI